MSLAEFWQQLEQQATPHIKAEVERRGWKLVHSEHGRWLAERKRPVWAENGNGPFDSWAGGIEASEMLAEIDRQEASIRQAVWGDVDIVFEREDGE